jgi:hypothetical protein
MPASAAHGNRPRLNSLRDVSTGNGRPGRDENEVRDWAREHDLPYFDDQVHFPDYRIEYELDGRELHHDVELFTPHYRGAHAASGAKAGFRIRILRSGDSCVARCATDR